MKVHLPLLRHSATPFIYLDTSRCQACWQCIQVCPTGTLGRVEIFRHRHVRIDRGSQCKGCRKCVRACPHGAILPVNHQALSKG